MTGTEPLAGQMSMSDMQSSSTVADSTIVAKLSNRGRYTVFEADGTRLMFVAPVTLERYLRVTEWDNGYIVVQTKYSNCDGPVEEYIDLIPVLENLSIDPRIFCARIKEVVVKYD